MSSSSFVLKRGDEVEITTKDINGMGLVLDEPIEKIQKENFVFREMGAINISDLALKVSAYRMKMG